MSKKSTYRSIGREIEQARMTRSSVASETLTEKELRNRATSLLQKPSLQKCYKSRKDGSIVKQNKYVEQLKSVYLDNSYQPKSTVSAQSSTNTLCFEIDFDWLDYCDDQKFKQIFKEDLKDIPDIEQYVEDNQQYLCHVFAQCACAKCTCNKCICPYKKIELNYLYGMQTSNRFDYMPKQNKNFTPIITQSHYDNIALPAQQMPFNSTQRDDYKWIQQDRPKTAAKSLDRYLQLPTGQTTNNIVLLTYINWKDYNQTVFKAPQHRTTVRANLMNRTNYRNQFIWKIKDENQPTAEDIKQKQMNKTFAKIFPNNNIRTLYQDSFIPKFQKPIRIIVKPEELMTCGAFAGQFTTTKQMDYDGKQIVTKEIQQKPWKNRLVKRLQNI